MHHQLTLWLLFKVGEAVPEVAHKRSWGDLLKEFLANPGRFAQRYMLWIIIFLVLLYAVQVLNNRLEEKGVTRAIFLSRGIVSTFTAFLVTPVAFILLINLIAVLNDLPTIDVSRIWDWIKLTGTTYYWLGKCLFGGARVMPNMYDGNSVIRILWVAIPIGYVWLRTASNNFWRLMFIPFLVGILLVTRHRVAEPTFLTPVVEKMAPDWFRKPGETFDPHNPKAEKLTDIKSLGLDSEELDLGRVNTYFGKNDNKVALLIVGLLGVALLIGFIWKKPVLGAVLALVAVVAFFMYRGQSLNWHPSGKTASERQVEIDSLIIRFNNIAQDTTKIGKSVELSNIAQRLSRRFKADDISPPDSFCVKYREYFYDFCKSSE